MTIRQITRGFATVALAIAMAAVFCAAASAQQPPLPASRPQRTRTQPGTPASSAPAIRAESRVVRVDVIVTDKKGNYVHDLTPKDFRVYDNDKEQQIVNFSFGSSESAAQTPERHYMVLFFDDSTMNFADQAQARQAALKFIDADAGPDRVMAVVDFTGALRIIQNFTGDTARLKRATEYAKSSAVSPNDSDSSSGGAEAGAPMPSLFNTGNDFGVYTLLLAIRTLAKDLAAVPGRKSVVLFTEGFPMTPDAAIDLTATISACNQANVAIYPLDVRGLIAPMPTGTQLFRQDAPSAAPHLVLAAFPQRGGAPCGGGGGGGGGGRGGGGGAPGGGGPVAAGAELRVVVAAVVGRPVAARRAEGWRAGPRRPGGGGCLTTRTRPTAQIHTATLSPR